MSINEEWAKKFQENGVSIEYEARFDFWTGALTVRPEGSQDLFRPLSEFQPK